MASEKVADTVATFLNEDRNGGLFKRVIGYSYQQVVSEFARVPVTKSEPKKVANMVGSFLVDLRKLSKRNIFLWQNKYFEIVINSCLTRFNLLKIKIL